ncbi:hypothetical protein LCGC14_3068110, partial [marine sediment metagenome]
MVQTAGTGNLASAQRIVIEQARYTAEHNAPMLQLVEKFKLAEGVKQIDVPKVGQFTAQSVGDGVDIVDEQDIGMTITTLTTSEVGMKIILTDKLVSQLNEDTFRMVGKQAGDAMARKKDRDLIALFTALNGGVDLGSTGRNLNIGNLGVLLGWALANKLPSPYHMVVHPWALADLTFSVGGIALGSATAGAALAGDYAVDILNKYSSTVNIGGMPVFHDGNIDIDTNADATGAIFSKEALAYAESVNYN